MDEEKRRRLESAGWSVGDVSDFLDLSPAEAEFIELKLALARGLRARREEKGLTQQEVALSARVRANRASRKWRPRTVP